MNGSEIVGTICNENGILNVTVAMLASRAMRRTAVAFLRQVDPQGAYAQYKALKHPPSGRTDETRRTGYAFALAKASELALANYVRGV